MNTITYGSKEWALKKCDEYRKEIKFYISEGISTSMALDMVLSQSILGAGYKAQIRSEFREVAK